MLTHPILSELAQSGIRLGLQNLAGFLESIGYGTLNIPCIHVAGTNGKGSVCRMLESVYQEAGQRVGLYTSPHLQQINERVRINGSDIDDENLDALLKELYYKSQEWATAQELPNESPLTYFEMMTAVALVAFSRANVDIVILEVGLGGRLDATNIVESTISVITSISLDHTDVLGSDLSSIATEKAGIIKNNTPVVLGMMDVEAKRAIRLIAELKSAPIYQLGDDFFFFESKDKGLVWHNKIHRLENILLALLGTHQQSNAGVAIMVVQLLLAQFPVSIDALYRGLQKSNNPGRMEWLSPNLLLDCAHNPAGAEQLASYLKELRHADPKRQIRLLLGASNDKDVHGVSIVLSNQVDQVYCTHCAHPRAMKSSELEQSLHLDIPVKDVGPVEQAFAQLYSDEGVLVVAGSIFLVGAVRDLWEHKINWSSNALQNVHSGS